MLKQIFLINTDLKMSAGKIAVQVAHGEVIYIEKIYLNSEKIVRDKNTERILNNYINWRSVTPKDPIGMMKKVVLKSTENNIRDYYIKLTNNNIWCYAIFDKGLTQITPNSLTCLIVEPLEEDTANKLFGELKLL